MDDVEARERRHKIIDELAAKDFAEMWKQNVAWAARNKRSFLTSNLPKRSSRLRSPQQSDSRRTVDTQEGMMTCSLIVPASLGLKCGRGRRRDSKPARECCGPWSD